MRIATRLLFALALVVLLAACGDDTTDAGTDPGDGRDGEEPDDGGTRPSVAGEWRLVFAIGTDGEEIGDAPGALEMTIDAGEIRGDAGCNQFFGTIDAADDGSLTISALGMTEMACVEQERMAFEAAYAALLGEMTTWEVTPEALVFSGDAGEIRYSQAPPPVHQPLEGTVWHFDTIYTGEGVNRAATNRADMDGVTLVISAGEAVIVGPDCEGTISSVQFDGERDGSFSVIAPGPIDSSPACEIVGIAGTGLRESTGYMIDENRLTFIGQAGETVGFVARP